MGKHKNLRQEKIIVNFMDEHQDLARNFVKGDKVYVDTLWTELTKLLNSEGPPNKDATGWKKVWFDWKCNIRKKLAHNKNETKSTGGGPNNVLPISSIEDTIAKITGIYTVVEGLGGRSFGTTTTENEEEENSENINLTNIQEPSTSRTRAENINLSNIQEPSTPTAIEIPNPKPRRRQNSIDKYMDAQICSLKNISDKLNKYVEIGNDNNSNTKRTYRGIEKLCDILKSKNDENKRHHLEIEKLKLENINIKKRKLEIEEMKLGMETTYDENT